LSKGEKEGIPLFAIHSQQMKRRYLPSSSANNFFTFVQESSAAFFS
jgi:hypothetical protein